MSRVNDDIVDLHAKRHASKRPTTAAPNAPKCAAPGAHITPTPSTLAATNPSTAVAPNLIQPTALPGKRPAARLTEQTAVNPSAAATSLARPSPLPGKRPAPQMPDQTAEDRWPTVRPVAKPEQNVNVLSRAERMARVKRMQITALTFACSFWAKPNDVRHSYDEKNNEIVGPYVLPPKDQADEEELPADKLVRQFKEITEIFLLGRKRLIEFCRKHPDFF